MHYNYIILGAGPAGLTFANKLLETKNLSFLILEKENSAGGLCRSSHVDQAPLDIGGGHFLDVRRTEVNQFLFRFMPEGEWNLFTRNSQIDLNGVLISHPLESNIWQLSIPEQVLYLKSIAQAGCNTGSAMPDSFIDWIYWKLGNKIAEDYMIPYNLKMFGEHLEQLGTYWLEKLPNVSFEDTLYSCLERKPYGSQPGHAQFFYPKHYGYGELWNRMAQNIHPHIIYNARINTINFDECSVSTQDGETYFADKIITTIPWASIQRYIGIPSSIASSIQRLQHTGIMVEYFPDHLDTNAHWIYIPNPDIDYHRILVRHNFCPNSKGYWTETNLARVQPRDKNSISFFNEYAYPLNTVEKPAIMKKLISFAQSKNIFALGRWGEHEHYNSDLTVAKALDLYKHLVTK